MSTFASILEAVGVRMHTSSVAQILEPYGHLPKKIQQAVLRVETHPHFIGLTRSMKAVLKTLIARANQEDGTIPIKVNAKRAAEAAEVCEKSVQRTINTLKKCGWIYQYGTGRTIYGEYSYKEYQFSSTLCHAVQLPAGGEKAIPSDAGTILSDGTIYDLNFKEDQRADALLKRAQANDEITLPPLLETMAIKLAIKPSGVCKLRGLAHQAGYHLEDIYVAIQANIDKLGLQASNAYNYLRAVILNPKQRDFKAIRTQIERSKIGSKLNARAKRFANQRYASVCGSTKVHVYDHIADITLPSGQIKVAVGREFEELLDRIERGELVAYINSPSKAPINDDKNGYGQVDRVGQASLANIKKILSQKGEMPMESTVALEDLSETTSISATTVKEKLKLVLEAPGNLAAAAAAGNESTADRIDALKRMLMTRKAPKQAQESVIVHRHPQYPSSPVLTL